MQGATREAALREASDQRSSAEARAADAEAARATAEEHLAREQQQRDELSVERTVILNYVQARATPCATARARTLAVRADRRSLCCP